VISPYTVWTFVLLIAFRRPFFLRRGFHTHVTIMCVVIRTQRRAADILSAFRPQIERGGPDPPMNLRSDTADILSAFEPLAT